MAPIRRNGRASATSQLKSMAAKTPGGVETHSSLEERVRSEFRSAWKRIFSRTGINIQDVMIQNLDPTWPIIKPIITQDEKSHLNTETMENKRRFNRAIKVGNDIKRNNKGMYAMDTFEQMNNARIMNNSIVGHMLEW